MKRWHRNCKEKLCAKKFSHRRKCGDKKGRKITGFIADNES
jgi:hypothetical protein